MGQLRVKESALKEVRKAEEKFDQMQEQVKEKATEALEASISSVSLPKCVDERDIRLSSVDRGKSKEAIRINPIRELTTSKPIPFNEKFRKAWEHDWTYVKAVVENNEIIGETVECWTKKYPGDPAHFWKVPVNRTVMIPRLLANQLAQCKYHRLVMEERPVQDSGGMTFYGAIEAVEVKHRINCHIINDDKTVAIGF